MSWTVFCLHFIVSRILDDPGDVTHQSCVLPRFTQNFKFLTNRTVKRTLIISDFNKLFCEDLKYFIFSWKLFLDILISVINDLKVQYIDTLKHRIIKCYHIFLNSALFAWSQNCKSWPHEYKLTFLLYRWKREQPDY